LRDEWWELKRRLESLGKRLLLNRRRTSSRVAGRKSDPRSEVEKKLRILGEREGWNETCWKVERDGRRGEGGGGRGAAERVLEGRLGSAHAKSCIVYTQSASRAHQFAVLKVERSIERKVVVGWESEGREEGELKSRRLRE